MMPEKKSIRSAPTISRMKAPRTGFPMIQPKSSMKMKLSAGLNQADNYYGDNEPGTHNLDITLEEFFPCYVPCVSLQQMPNITTNQPIRLLFLNKKDKPPVEISPGSQPYARLKARSSDTSVFMFQSREFKMDC